MDIDLLSELDERSDDGCGWILERRLHFQSRRRTPHHILELRQLAQSRSQFGFRDRGIQDFAWKLETIGGGEESIVPAVARVLPAVELVALQPVALRAIAKRGL
jgi:hypothetical protein